MADPLGSLEKIVKLALRIKEAVDTVRRNKEECQQIRRRAMRISSLLSRLPETGMTADPAMCGALEDLEDSLRRAHKLIEACQDGTTPVCLYCTAGRQARRLRQVQDDISQKVMLVIFATNIQTTIILTNIRVGDAVPPPPPMERKPVHCVHPVILLPRVLSSERLATAITRLLSICTLRYLPPYHRGRRAGGAVAGTLRYLPPNRRCRIEACQDGTTPVCLYCTAGRQASRLRRVQDGISQKVMLVIFATNIQTTIILTNICVGNATSAPPRAIPTRNPAHAVQAVAIRSPRRSNFRSWLNPHQLEE
ncbi:hypothetical protein HU200_013957 [Digitaria exilis]|uniref:MCAfunc domain-containing protein n=1 Tax=Digitaria exilis TaxID=1010633 RepID=A0A835KLY4_9POAL|nr:hypothetical protein HU200_013957 [Digitaria exilis]